MTWLTLWQVAVAESKVTPGVLGFLVVALLGVATYLLIRSMNRQIRRIDLPPNETEPDEELPDDPVSGAADRP
ncbi:MAG: hypothetical protein LH461_04860 [Spirochaetaceae bacterium]|nr:hypothetical protein [Spirochaetaceae bacterium]